MPPLGCSSTPMTRPAGILFTAFETSGDEHAAPVIAELRRREPDVPIYGLGGPRMAAAGAEIIEQTSGMGLMLADSAGHIPEHFRRVGRVKAWLKEHPIAVHVPTDSPAANWSFCALVKRMYGKPAPGRPAARVVHLVAPQVWAWASWRVRRLRKWSDLVLCLLPFEPAWFEKRGVRARFIGHPLFDEPVDVDNCNWQSMHYPGGSPKVALLPGSRPNELRRNWPTIVRVFKRITEQLPDAQATVAAVNEKAAARLREMVDDLPANLNIVADQTEAVLHWSDVVLTVSGTATLHIARHQKPMCIMYRVNKWNWLLAGRFIVNTRTFTLPNLITLGEPRASSDGHIIREFVPHYGDPQEIVDEVVSLVTDEDKRNAQIKALADVLGKFDAHVAGKEAADAIVAELRKAQAEAEM